MAQLFFVISNFMVWLNSGMYQHTLDGLLICYINAIPFYGNTCSTFYSYLLLLFDVTVKKYEFISR